MFEALLLSFWLIFVAELGDKSQLLAALFATRYKTTQVLLAIGTATAVLIGLSVIVGEVAATALPSDLVSFVAGLAFIGFGLSTLKDGLSAEEEQESAKLQASARSPFLAMTSSFFLAELGDKTMLATITLAATNNSLGVWAGGSAGMFLADALAVVAAKYLGDKVRGRTITLIAAAMFLAVGSILIFQALNS